MKIIHTSDWHLGRYLHDYPLLECQEFFLKWFIEFLKNNKHDAVIIAGDIFDRSVPPAEAVALFGWFLAEFNKLGTSDLFVIAGNHDSADRLAYCSEILQNNRIYIYGGREHAARPVILTKDGINYYFYMLPFLSGSMPDETEGSSEFLEILKLIETKKSKSSVNIFIGHAFVAGSEISESERVYVGGLASVSKTVFDHFDYTAMGHLHKGQKISGKAYYSGSPLKYSFSEFKDDKHLLSIEFLKGDISIEEIPVPQKIEMKRISDKFENFLNDKKYEEVRDCFLELELSDDGIVESPVSVLKNRFPYLLSVRQNMSCISSGGDDIGEFNENKSPLEYLENFYEYAAGRKPEKREIQLFKDLSGDIH
ncbi:MAG: exonuclease SbcCD subunit D [Spirochaetes bacterium]|nr:exonuclease SbcCD subunit D [Spirochaetota bacterium]